MTDIKLPPHLKKLVDDPSFVRNFKKMQDELKPRTKVIKRKGYTMEEYSPF